MTEEVDALVKAWRSKGWARGVAYNGIRHEFCEEAIERASDSLLALFSPAPQQTDELGAPGDLL